MNQKLINILKSAGAAHHQAYLSVDGADDCWRTWYARFLIDQSDFAKHVDGYDEPKLAQKLQELEAEYRSQQRPEHWSEFYAARL